MNVCFLFIISSDEKEYAHEMQELKMEIEKQILFIDAFATEMFSTQSQQQEIQN